MLDDLERKLNRRIEILNGVAITATLYERFVKAFLKQIQGNPQISYPNKEVCLLMDGLFIFRN